MRFALLLLIASTVVAVPAAARSDVVDPPRLIAALGDRALAIVHETRPDSSSRFARFHDLIAETFDVPFLARFVAGRFWDGATDADRRRFTVAFGRYVTELFTARLSNYDAQRFTIVGQRADSDGTTVVSSEIVEPDATGGDRVDWHVAKTEGGFRIIDVAVSGVSIARTKRDEFGSLLARGGGIAALTAALERRISSENSAAATDD